MSDLSRTTNHYYSDNIQKSRHDKYKAMASNACKDATVGVFGSGGPTINVETFQREMEKAVERDMETFAAEQALESQRAIYKVHSTISV